MNTKKIEEGISKYFLNFIINIGVFLLILFPTAVELMVRSQMFDSSNLGGSCSDAYAEDKFGFAFLFAFFLAPIGSAILAFVLSFFASFPKKALVFAGLYFFVLGASQFSRVQRYGCSDAHSSQIASMIGANQVDLSNSEYNRGIGGFDGSYYGDATTVHRYPCKAVYSILNSNYSLSKEEPSKVKSEDKICRETINNRVLYFSKQEGHEVHNINIDTKSGEIKIHTSSTDDYRPNDYPKDSIPKCEKSLIEKLKATCPNLEKSY